VIVIGCVPEYDAPLARLLTYSIAWDDPAMPSHHLLKRDAEVEKQLRTLVVDTWHVPYASPFEELCQDGHCIEFVDAERNIPLMDDSHHFNRFGAGFVISQLVEQGKIY